MKVDWRIGGHDWIIAADRSTRSVYDVIAGEIEASFGTRWSSRTGECSNRVDTTFLSALSLPSGVPLWRSSRGGSCTDDEVMEKAKILA